jgi:hypothetical protein
LPEAVILAQRFFFPAAAARIAVFAVGKKNRAGVARAI